jgi:hypothetical protein
MMELTRLRDWLAAQSGYWSDIARRSGISTKTISRIVNDDAYLFRLRINTFMALDCERMRVQVQKKSLKGAPRAAR